MLASNILANLTHRFAFRFARMKKLRQLTDVRISLNDQQPSPSTDTTKPTKTQSYTQLRSELQNLGWEMMSFDKLCSLPEQTIKAIEIEIKKDKFNVDDSEFYQFRTYLLPQAEIQLNAYYAKTQALIRNKHEDYDRMQPAKSLYFKYLHQIYLNDLKHDKVLNSLLTFFINNLEFPDKLEALVEPGLVKKLLTLRRQLMIQGIKFKRLAEVKEAKKEERKIRRAKQRALKTQNNQQNQQEEEVEKELLDDQEKQEQELLNQVEAQIKLNNRIRDIMTEVQKYQNVVEVAEVIGYEYEFWVDVKHNRKKNGVSDDYIIEQREIDNPNDTILLVQKYPKVKVKYIVRKQKRKDYTMHFCSKAELLVKINKQHFRRVKIEWNGPANKQSPQTSTDYKIIDYQLLMNGNPTIKPVFQF